MTDKATEPKRDSGTVESLVRPIEIVAFDEQGNIMARLQWMGEGRAPFILGDPDVVAASFSLNRLSAILPNICDQVFEPCGAILAQQEA